MIQHTFKRTGIVLLAILGSIALVVLLATVTTTLTVLNRTAADLLPARQTIALFHFPEAKDLELLRTLFPTVKIQENGVLPEAIAILELPSAQKASVLFYQEGNAPLNNMGLSATLGTYVATTTEEEALSFVRQGEERLAYDTDHMTLHKTKDRKQPWVFVRSSSLQSAEGPFGQLVQSLLLQQGSALALDADENGWQTLKVLGEKKTLLEPSLLPPAPTESTVLTVGVTAIDDLWSNALQDMQKEERIVLTGIVHNVIRKGFGTSVSTEYDILPLLQRGNIITVNRTESGQLIGMLRGYAEDTAHLTRTLDRIHQGFRTKLPSIETQTYRFDDRFTTTNIRSDRSAVEEEVFIQDNWHIRSTHKTNSVSGFFTAVRQNEYIMSNNRDMLLQTMKQNSPLLSGRESEHLVQSTRQAIGWFDIMALRELLSTNFPALQTNTTVLLPSVTQNHVVWSLERQGHVSVIRRYRE